MRKIARYFFAEIHVEMFHLIEKEHIFMRYIEKDSLSFFAAIHVEIFYLIENEHISMRYNEIPHGTWSFFAAIHVEMFYLIGFQLLVDQVVFAYGRRQLSSWSMNRTTMA